MINLIPQSAKTSITREYWVRVINVWILSFSGVFVIISILLIPVYILINSQTAVYAKDAEVALVEVNKFDLSSASLIKSGQQAKLLLNLKNEIRFTNLVSLLESTQNPSVAITRFDFTKVDAELNPISITGTALTRQSLADFREALLNHPDIETVLLPISNLALDRDIIFNVTITMKKP